MTTYQTLIESYRADRWIKLLSPYISERRKERIQEVLNKRIQSIRVAVESPFDLHNVLAIVRTAEALGLLHVHIINYEGKKKTGPGTTRGTHHWMHIHHETSLEESISEMKSQGLLIAGATPDGNVPISELPTNRPICLLFGNEKRGLSGQAKKLCDETFYIPMQGMAESLNLSVSAAVSLYDLTHRYRQFSDGDLSQEELERETARSYIRSVGIKQSEILMKQYSSIEAE